MFLTRANLFHYLRARGFASPRCVASGAFHVRAQARRNHSFFVRTSGPGLFVKQPKEWTPQARASFSREAAWNAILRGNDRFAFARSLTPDCLSWDPAHSILIYELLPAEANLAVAANPSAPALLGRTLARFHRLAAPLREETSALRPWIFQLMDLTSADLASEPEPRRDWLRGLHSEPVFAKGLHEALRNWQPETIIHGDLRLGNCFCLDERRVLLADWEFHGRGDPAWDAACAISCWVEDWVRNPDVYPLPGCRTRIAAFLAAFEGQHDARLAHFLAARLLQSSWELLQRPPRVTALVLQLSQLALHLFERPEILRTELLAA